MESFYLGLISGKDRHSLHKINFFSLLTPSDVTVGYCDRIAKTEPVKGSVCICFAGLCQQQFWLCWPNHSPVPLGFTNLPCKVHHSPSPLPSPSSPHAPSPWEGPHAAIRQFLLLLFLIFFFLLLPTSAEGLGESDPTPRGPTSHLCDRCLVFGRSDTG